MQLSKRPFGNLEIGHVHVQVVDEEDFNTDEAGTRDGRVTSHARQREREREMYKCAISRGMSQPVTCVIASLQQ